MGKIYRWLLKFSSENKDIVNLLRAVLSLFALIFAAIALYFKDSPKNSGYQPTSLWSKIGQFANETLVLPYYTVLLLGVLLYFIYLYVKRRRVLQLKIKNSLIGNWENRWDGPQPGREFFVITNDFKYILNGTHYFDIKKFRFNKRRNEIRFLKVGAKKEDPRVLLNVLSYNNAMEMKGQEIAKTKENYGITYVKIDTLNANPDNPSLSVKVFSSFSESKETTYPLKIHFHISGKQHRSIVINSITFFGGLFIEIEKKAGRFLPPNSYNCDISQLGKEKYSEELIINLAVKAECWVPINPLIGKFALDRALQEKVAGILHFNYAFAEDKSRTYPYTCLF